MKSIGVLVVILLLGTCLYFIIEYITGFNMKKFFSKIGKVIFGVFVIAILIYSAKDAFWISNERVEDEAYARQIAEDGLYSADVSYYNKCTGYKNYYELTVELEADEVVKIIFENGGYLDRRHITPSKIDKKGKTLVKNKDGCTEYNVKIKYKQ